MTQTIFKSNNVNDIIHYVEQGNDITITSDPNVYPEKPGASLLHFMSSKADLESIKHLIEIGLNPNLLDHDKCSPFGYLVNDELLWELENTNRATTANSDCTDRTRIKECIKYMLDINAKCVYLDKEYNKAFIEDYLSKL